MASLASAAKPTARPYSKRSLVSFHIRVGRSVRSLPSLCTGRKSFSDHVQLTRPWTSYALSPPVPTDPRPLYLPHDLLVTTSDSRTTFCNDLPLILDETENWAVSKRALSCLSFPQCRTSRLIVLHLPTHRNEYREGRARCQAKVNMDQSRAQRQ